MSATLDGSIEQGGAALSALYALQTSAMKLGDLATQKALGGDIDELTYKLTQLRGEAIADDDARIGALNIQLGAVTASAKAALSDVAKTGTVLTNVIAAAKLVDQLLSIVAKV